MSNTKGANLPELKGKTVVNLTPQDVADEIAESTGGQFTGKQIYAMKRAGIIPPQAKRYDMELFLFACQAVGANPIIKQAYILARNKKKLDEFGRQVQGPDGRGVWEVGFYHVFDYKFIMGKCDETGEWGGMSEVTYDGGKTLDECIASGITKPSIAKVTIYRWKNGQKDGTTAEVSWQEYGGTSPNWNNNPFTMLGKVAKRVGCTGAFPAATQNMYIAEEFANIEAPQETIIQNREGEEIIPSEKFYALEATTTESELQEMIDGNKELNSNQQWVDAVIAKREELEGAENDQ